MGVTGVAMATGVIEEVLWQGEGGVKDGAMNLKPGLFGEGRRAQGERAKLACNFSMRAEFLLGLTANGEVAPSAFSCSAGVCVGICKDRGGRRLTGLVAGAWSSSGVTAASLNFPASSATDRFAGASSSILRDIDARGNFVFSVPRVPCALCVYVGRSLGGVIFSTRSHMSSALG